MSDEQPEDHAPQLYRDRIKELYEQAGSPSQTVVNRIVARLDEFYPLAGGRITLPESVGRSTLSKVVRGIQLPSAGMLTVIVLSLQRCGWENGSLSEDPGQAGLEEWHRLLRNAKAAAGARSRAATVRDGGDGPVRPADPVRLEPGELAELGGHGRYASALVSRAGRGDRDAVYEIAVILGCGTRYGRKAVAYLLNALAAGRRVASDLLPMDDGDVDRRLAQAHARVLAYAAELRGDGEAAHTFRSCAPTGGVVPPMRTPDTEPK